jgi:hypothetical protein
VPISLKKCGKGTSSAKIISAAWGKVPESEKVSFGTWTTAKWTEYLTELVTKAAVELQKADAVVKNKERKAATRTQPKRR